MRFNSFSLISILMIFSVFFISGCLQQEQPIGGERDEHGCLGPAGYTWDEDVGACTRNWELNENQKDAAKIAIDHLNPIKGATINSVNVARCPGCFLVNVRLHLNSGDKDVEVNIENWIVVDSPTSEDSLEQACIDSGGNVGISLCCKSVGDFPDNCAVGACGCAPDQSHEVKVCNCGDITEKCWNGETCIQQNVPDDVSCISPNGTGMMLSEAKSIALASDCIENGTLTDTTQCNSDTGTWWIDLDIEKPGCLPACVVNIGTGNAEINWRCTGVL